MNPDQLFDRGWTWFPHDARIADWAAQVAPVAEATFHDPALRAKWLRCGGTWFAGVNALPNDETGAIASAGVPALSGSVIDFIAGELGFEAIAWDRSQISICLPGYPQPWDGETDAAFRYRRDRDAAHIDGLMRDADRNRRPNECHAFILGLPLSEVSPEAAPFVAYEGSHHVMRDALRERLSGVDPLLWREEDVTEAYVTARRRVFDTCRRVEIPARPGEAYLAHRLILHGVAPWRGFDEGMRMVAYFRPDPYPGQSPEWWLTDG